MSRRRTLPAGVGHDLAVGELAQVEHVHELLAAGEHVCLGAAVEPALQQQVLAPGRQRIGAAELADEAGVRAYLLRARGPRRSRRRVAVPESIGSSVVSIRRVVVLPAPLGPRKPKISPRCTVMLTPRTASTGPRRDLKLFFSSVAVMTLSSALTSGMRSLSGFSESLLDPRVDYTSDGAR